MLRVVGRPKGDVVNRARALARGQEFARGPQIDDAADPHPRRLKPLRRSLASAADKAEDVGENGGGRAGFSEQQAHTVEASNGMFRGNAASAPSRFGLDALDAAERQPGPVLILERDRRCAEALHGRIVGDALLDQALGPVADRAFRNAEDGLLRLSDPEPAGLPRPPMRRRSRSSPDDRPHRRSSDDRSRGRRN